MRKRNIMLRVAFDGSAYSGWQRQQNAPTVQAALEERLQVMLDAPVNLHGAGRTDAGVHALGMVANFHTTAAIPCLGIMRGLNSMLPGDIRILGAVEAHPDFHSRYNAAGKSYRYDLFTGEIQLPTTRLYCAHMPGPIHIDAIKKCLAHIQGRHDFSSFEAAGSRDTGRPGSRGAVRTLIHAGCIPHPHRQNTWSFRFVGDGFLRHMVRNLVGTLCEAGRGSLTPDDFLDIMRRRDRSAAGPTAPAHGLFLEEVYYDRIPLDRTSS